MWNTVTSISFWKMTCPLHRGKSNWRSSHKPQCLVNVMLCLSLFITDDDTHKWGTWQKRAEHCNFTRTEFSRTHPSIIATKDLMKAGTKWLVGTIKRKLNKQELHANLTTQHSWWQSGFSLTLYTVSQYSGMHSVWAFFGMARILAWDFQELTINELRINSTQKQWHTNIILTELCHFNLIMGGIKWFNVKKRDFV